MKNEISYKIRGDKRGSMLIVCKLLYQVSILKTILIFC